MHPPETTGHKPNHMDKGRDTPLGNTGPIHKEPMMTSFKAAASRLRVPNVTAISWAPSVPPTTTCAAATLSLRYLDTRLRTRPNSASPVSQLSKWHTSVPCCWMGIQ